MIRRYPKGARTDKLKRVDTNGFECCQVGVEYYSPKQCGGLNGVIYRQYFLTSLPAALTAGDNVSGLIDYGLTADDATDRHLFRGWSDNGTLSAKIKLSGTSGFGNLSLAVAGVTVQCGWVEYTK